MFSHPDAEINREENAENGGVFGVLGVSILRRSPFGSGTRPVFYFLNIGQRDQSRDPVPVIHNNE
jgi:hypothetical protein